MSLRHTADGAASQRRVSPPTNAVTVVTSPGSTSSAPRLRTQRPRAAGAVRLHVAFGLAVRRVRAQAALSQEELGYRSGLHRNYVGLIERGKRVPTLRTVE